MAEIASAYISLIPSMRGFGAAVSRQVNGIGQGAGADFSQQFIRAADGSLRDLQGRFVRDASDAGVDSGDAFGDSFGAATEQSAGGIGADFGKKLGAAAALGIGAAVGLSIKEAADQEVSSDRLAAALGSNEKQAARLGRIAGRIYTNNFGESFGAVTEALDAVKSSFRGLGGKELQSVTQQAIAFSDIFGVDVPRAVSVAQTVVKSGLAKDSTEALDLLTASAQRVPAALRENILDAADEYGQFFKAAGFGGEQTFTALVDNAKLGEFGIDKAGDAIKEFTILSTDMSTNSVAAYDTLGLNAGKMANDILAGGDKAKGATKKIVDGLLGIKDPAKQANTAIQLFGTPLEDLGVKNIPTFLKSLKTGRKGLGDFAGATKRASDVVGDNASGNLESFRRKITQTFVEVIGGSVIPFIRDFAAALSEKAAPVLGRIRDAAAKVAPLFERLGNFLRDNSEYVKTFATVLGVLAAGIGLVTGATTLFSIALNSTGIPLIVIGIAALVAGLVIAYRRSEAFRNVVNQVGAAVKSFGGFLRAEVIPAVVSTAKSVGNSLRPILAQLGETFRNDILPLVQKAIAKFREWQPAMQKAAGIVVRVVAGLVKFYAQLASRVIPVLIRFVGFIIRNVAPAIAQFVSDIARGIKAAVDFGKKLINAAKDVAEFANKVRTKVGEVIKIVLDLPDRAKSAIGDLGSTLKDAGRELIQGLINGITEKLSDLAGKMRDVANTIGGFLPGSPVKEGPLKGWNDGKGGVSAAGQRVVGGIVEGIGRGLPSLKGKMDDVAEVLAKGAEKGAKDAVKRLQKLVDGAKKVVDKVKSNLDRVQGLFDGVASSVRDAFRPDLFSGGLGDLFSNGTTGLAAIKNVLAAFKKLKGIKGVSDQFLSDLFASGNTGLILQLAGSDAATVQGASSLYGQTNSLSSQLGTAVARNQYGEQLTDIRGELREANRNLSQLADKLAAAINKAARDGRRKGKK